MNFPTTRWSLLAQASADGGVQARKALEELCGRYWGPIHQFLRARQISDPEAQDLTQDFMMHLLQKSLFERADPLRGRFRSFLLGALVRFLAGATIKRTALKREGTRSHYSVEEVGSESLPEFFCEPEAARVFDREWALTILESALERVRLEYAQQGRVEVFAVLRQFLPDSAESQSYRQAGRQLGMALGTVKSEVHRLRRRLHALVREAVAETVSTPHELEEEMAHLQRVLMERSVEFARAVQLGVADS
ncbi:MAG: sigma-70 family RNA polymerase sigma factor [Verrucomicrobia bacterium]|nr:sigma-70 family RNA polymerase sigma factor [Verrucomicrobiota bacterium]